MRFACWSGPTYRGVGRDLCSPEWLNWAFRMGAYCTFVINRAVVEGWEVIACNMPPAKALEH